MSMTLDQVKALTYRQEVHSDNQVNHGTCERWRVNGAVQTWKTRPDDVRVPVKHELRDYTNITKLNMSFYHLHSECPRNASLYVHDHGNDSKNHSHD